MAPYTPQLIESVRHDYENTDKSVDRIAADHQISDRTVNRMRDRGQWTPRSARVHDVPACVQALRELEKLEAQPAAPPGEPGSPAAPEAEFSRERAIARIERLVERELDVEEAARARLGALPREPAEAERCARTLSTLTQTLHALARLRSGLPPDQGLNNDDMPRDIDAFRREFARRIRLFMESRAAGDIRSDAAVDDARHGDA